MSSNCQEAAVVGMKRKMQESGSSEGVSMHVRRLSESEDEVEVVTARASDSAGEDAGSPGSLAASAEMRGVHVVTPGKRQAVVRSKLRPSGPVFPSKMPVEDLALLELDLMETRQMVDRMEQLESAHRRNWHGKWWAKSVAEDLEWEWSRQLREFRDAVARGAVTERQRSYLLHRVDSV